MKLVLALSLLVFVSMESSVATEKTVKIVLVGDSTVNDAQGWGTGFKKLLKPGVECVNWAKNGRSSKSFINEGWWEKALAEKPDFVLIQFGHNDMPGKGPDRETDPATTYMQFMARYIDEARAAGAKPILVTSMTRRRFTPEGKIDSDLWPYVEVVKKLAADKRVPLIDLHERSIALLNQLGPKASEEFDPPATTNKTDKTHLAPKGIEVMGRLVAEDLKKVEPELASFLLVFTAKASTVKPDITVAADGSADFKTIQEALDSIPRDNRQRMIILIKDGVYHEKVRIDSDFVTLRGQSRQGAHIEFAQGENEFNREPDKLGRAVVNINGNDFVMENLTVKNTHGVIGPHAFAVYGKGDRTVIVDCDVLSDGADTLALWGDRSGSYQARLNIRGSVDFVCPRGWCYMTDCNFYEINPNAHAAIWHDGSKDKDMKFVLRNCRFDGVDNWILARHHHDAQFFLLDCTFSKVMRDLPPKRVIYPIEGDKPKDADAKKNRDLDASNIWGERAYFYNCHREGGDYAWHANNLPVAPELITAAWTFAGKWDPERRAGPTIQKVVKQVDRVEVVFSENVTVKGGPRLGSAEYANGSGTDKLVFTGMASNAATIDLQGGAIIASEATATLRDADVSLPHLPAFPGAEGFGANATGGRGGDVYYVTNLEDDGPGSLRYGINSATNSRAILFKVSGNICLKSQLKVDKPRLTIAGQTAPGDGICLQDYTLELKADDLIVRHIRSRLGTNGHQQSDGITITGGTNIIVDHCSASWSVDEVLSPVGQTDRLTVQWTFITEALNESIHVKGPHGYGSLIRPRVDASYTFHHNLYAHNNSRNPRAGTYGANVLRLDFRNNVIYNWGIKAGYNYYPFENLELNYINNYLIRGPATTCFSCAFESVATNTLIYQSGNLFDINLNGRADGTNTGWRMFVGDHKKRTEPHAAPPVATDSAEVAYERVLAEAGALPWRRDPVDARIVRDVGEQTGRLINSTEEVGGWPTLRSEEPPVDSDGDGMPDSWEKSRGLNPKDAGDRNATSPSGYTQLEEYLNSLAQKEAL